MQCVPVRLPGKPLVRSGAANARRQDLGGRDGKGKWLKMDQLMILRVDKVGDVVEELGWT